MAFSNFRLNVAARALLLVVCISVAIWGRVGAHWEVTPVVAGLLALLLVAELIWYVERTQRELTSFLSSIAHQDYSVPIPELRKGRVFDKLENAYRVLSAQFTRLNLQKAANHEYLEAVVEHVGVALVSLDDTGQVAMMNERARRLFGQPQPLSSKSFARFDSRLPALLDKLGDSDRNLLRVQRGDDTLQLVLYCTCFTLLDRRYKLVSFQNIRDELERREIESWQKLIRVLTHEIMNSVTPIISLSKLIQETLGGDKAGPATALTLTGEERSDLQRSADAVHSRSSGLLEFVKAYRSFASVPVPVMTDGELLPLLERVRTLMADALAAHRVTMEIQCAGRLFFHADPRQVEQVLINLSRNAIEALVDTPDPRILLRGSRNDQGRAVIQVADNGPGIDAAHLDNIFVPFFTTKRGGTGVGLSISRQLVQANRGFISVKSGESGGSVFVLSLPAPAQQQ
jgi:two-component system, NtrC family, nitrogen regulation sensor histidine kinase NtrY